MENRKTIVSAAIILLGSASIIGSNLPLLACQATRFVKTTNGEQVVLKGADVNNNSWGNWVWPLSDSLQAHGKYPLFPPEKTVTEFIDSYDLARIKEMHLNAIRYEIAYETFAKENPYRDENLSALRSMIGRFDSIGAYTIVSLVVHPGLNVPNDNNCERIKNGKDRLPSVFESDSVLDLWKTMWTFLADGLKDLGGVAGYEVLNEPRLPAAADCSLAEAIEKYMEIYRSIRNADPSHIIFIPEFNSREANPGETYWSEKSGTSVIDTGEQGVLWEASFPNLPDSLKNVSYVAHVYDPYEFTSMGASTFGKSSVASFIDGKVRYIHGKNRPGIVTEYGVNYLQNLKNNVSAKADWFHAVHDIFDKHGLSSTVFTYKHLISPYVGPGDLFGLYFHFNEFEKYLRIQNDSLEYKFTADRDAAVASGMNSTIQKYFHTNSEFVPISAVGNDSVIEEIRRYASEEASAIIPAIHPNRKNSAYYGPNTGANTIVVDIRGKRLNGAANNGSPVGGKAISGLYLYKAGNNWRKMVSVFP